MDVRNVGEVRALFNKVYERAARNLKKIDEESQKKAMEAFGKALRACDRASERMIDKHHESVAKSAKMRAEYHKRKYQLDKIRAAAEKQELINESVMIQRLNHRNMLEEIRVDQLNREEMQRAIREKNRDQR